ncbi:hypothetical protein CYLTODRAFT_417989 [Cylindrobasidium torrendii FP15055 ss-10]|uniref:Carbohydrate esterase family 16 protein n=1 Tax=Cylindrobasidium torrendii FP15055 ss-10 TaxID=1314674 RepID=A0A0D7BS15_9AGAR|nr:hypothetical protein CYLTODRAFT_417989 [Cylindrobasidium torrendii FP15055 ss-10]
MGRIPRRRHRGKSHRLCCVSTSQCFALRRLTRQKVSGSVVDESYYDTQPSSTDFVAQVNKAASNRDKPDSATTLYAMYLGMEDYKRMDAATFPNVASNIAYQSLVLTSSPRAKNLLYLDSYGRGKNSTSGEEYKLNLFKSVGALHNRNVNVGFVDIGQVFDQVSADPTDTGFRGMGPCADAACDKADDFFYSEDFPSTKGHKVIADFVQAVLEECV